MEDGRVDVYENACARLALERVRFERVYNVTGREVRAPPRPCKNGHAYKPSR